MQKAFPQGSSVPLSFHVSG